MNVFEYCGQQGRNDVTVKEYADFQGWPGYIISGIEDEIVGGTVDQNEASRLAEAIIENVGSSSFQWTGAKAGRLLEGSMTGDCWVLVEGVVKAIIELALGDAHIESKHEPFMVMQSPTQMIGFTQPNIDGLGNSWKFDDHHWLVYEGVEYDLLFCGTLLDKSTWVDMVSDDDAGGWITQTYNDGTVLYWTNAQPAWSVDPNKAFNTANVNFNVEVGKVQTMDFLDTVALTLGGWQDWLSQTITSLSNSVTQEVNEALSKVNDALMQAKTVLPEKEDKQ